MGLMLPHNTTYLRLYLINLAKLLGKDRRMNDRERGRVKRIHSPRIRRKTMGDKIKELRERTKLTEEEIKRIQDEAITANSVDIWAIVMVYQKLTARKQQDKMLKDPDLCLIDRDKELPPNPYPKYIFPMDVEEGGKIQREKLGDKLTTSVNGAFGRHVYSFCQDDMLKAGAIFGIPLALENKEERNGKNNR